MVATVISLDDFRAAVRARDVLVGLLHRPPWLASVEAGCIKGRTYLRVAVRWDGPMVRACLPKRVNRLPVVVTLATKGAA